MKFKNFKLKTILAIILFELVFSAITFPILIFYGPYKYVTNYAVGTLYQSLRFAFVAKIFYSEKDISQILAIGASIPDKGKTNITDNQNTSDSGGIDVEIKGIGDESVDYTKIVNSGFTAHLLTIPDPSRVQVGVVKTLYQEGQKTSSLAKSLDAVCAINGGGFSDITQNANNLYAGNGGTPTGLVISHGQKIHSDSKDDNTKFDGVIAMTEENKLIVGRYSYNELKSKKVRDCISFHLPGAPNTLIVDGKKSPLPGDSANARTAIGQTKNGSIIFIVADGKQLGSLGARYSNIQDILLDKGVRNASYLDGGASSTMYYNGEVVNSTSATTERSIPTIFYFK